MTRFASRPPTITMANGRCESEPMACEKRSGQQAERGDQHGHHHGPKAQHGALDRGFDNVFADLIPPCPCGARAIG